MCALNFSRSIQQENSGTVKSAGMSVVDMIIILLLDGMFYNR